MEKNDYYSRLKKCEDNRSRAVMITKKFRAAYDVTVPPSFAMFLYVFIRLITRAMTANILINMHSVYLILSVMCGAGIIWLGSFAAAEKAPRVIFYEIILIIVRCTLDMAAGGIFLFGIPFGIAGIILWKLSSKYCAEWERLSREEGFPDFNPLLIRNENIIPNTGRDRSVPKPPPNPNMEEI